MNALATPDTLPSAEEVALARESGRVLSAVLQTRADMQLVDFHGEQGAVRSVRLPTSALRLLLDALAEIGQGNAVSIIPIHAELTTQEAANMLNVSRPYIVKLLKEGVIPYKEVGTHRRILLEDLVAYSKDMKQKRKEALEELARLGQQYNM